MDQNLLFIYVSLYSLMHRIPKKEATKLLAVNSSNLLQILKKMQTRKFYF